MSKLCKKCAMGFGSAKALESHIATVHNGKTVAKAPKKAPAKVKPTPATSTEDK
jgi:hypothetical protein